MRVLLKLMLFVVLLVTFFVFALFLFPEPSGKGEKFSIGKSTNLEKVQFLPGKYGGTLYLAVSSDPKTFNLVMAHETSSTDAVVELFKV